MYLISELFCSIVSHFPTLYRECSQVFFGENFSPSELTARPKCTGPKKQKCLFWAGFPSWLQSQLRSAYLIWSWNEGERNFHQRLLDWLRQCEKWHLVELLGFFLKNHDFMGQFSRWVWIVIWNGANEHFWLVAYLFRRSTALWFVCFNRSQDCSIRTWRG